MDNISRNKENFFKKHNMAFDVTKSNDVLGKDSVRARDILNGKPGEDKKIDRMSDIFPRSNQGGSDQLS